jgi:hypothetical protein
VADLAAILERIDGALIGGAIGFAINGLLARYPDLEKAVDRVTNQNGRDTLVALSDACIGDVITRYPFMKTSSLTIDGRPLSTHLQAIPEAAPALAELRVGTLTPASPVLITSGSPTTGAPRARRSPSAPTNCRRCCPEPPSLAISGRR